MGNEIEQTIPLAIYKPHEGYNFLTQKVESYSNKTPNLDINLSQKQGTPVYRCMICGSTYDISGNDIIVLYNQF